MKDLILDVYELIRQSPRTIKELVEELEKPKSVIEKKVNALDDLGKIKLFKGDSGHWIAYHRAKRSEEDVEEEALQSLEARQK